MKKRSMVNKVCCDLIYFKEIITFYFCTGEEEAKKVEDKNEGESSDSEDEPDGVPLSRLRPNRNRPVLYGNGYRSNNITSSYHTRSNQSYNTSRSEGHKKNFEPRSSPTFRTRRTRRTEKDTGIQLQ